MADQALTRLMKKARTGHAGRSEAYGWLRVRFEHFCPLLERRNLSFREIAEELAIDGILGGRGRPMTAHAARRIWGRVVHDVTAEEPWRMAAARTAMQQGGALHKPRTREPGRGKDADRPPPIVTAPAPSLLVPHYPPPSSSTPPARSAPDSRPNAPSKPGGAIQTPEEMRADIRATIKRRSQYF